MYVDCMDIFLRVNAIWLYSDAIRYLKLFYSYFSSLPQQIACSGFSFFFSEDLWNKFLGVAAVRKNIKLKDLEIIATTLRTQAFVSHGLPFLFTGSFWVTSYPLNKFSHA